LTREPPAGTEMFCAKAETSRWTDRWS